MPHSLPQKLADHLLAGNPAPVLILDLAPAAVQQVNRAAIDFYSEPATKLAGRPFTAFFRHPDDGERILLGRITHVPLQYHLGGDGRHLPVQLDIQWLDDDGLILVFVRDLSNQLTLDNQRMIAQRNYDRLFEFAPLPMLMLDRNRFVVGANRSALMLYQCEEKTMPLVGMASLLVNPIDLDGYRFQLDTLTLPPHWHWRGSGEQMLLQATISTLRRDHQTYLLVVLDDITESERKFSEIRQAEERWRFALDGHGDGVWEWLPVTGEAIVSARFLEMLGFTADDARQHFDYWDARVHPDDYQRVHKAIIQHLLAECPVISADFRMMSIDGQYRWMAIRARAIEHDAAGNVRRIIGTVRDIHDQRQQEFREQQHQEQLMHTARLATMGELVTVIAHEVAQPLTAISNYAAVARHHVSQGENVCDALLPLERITDLVRNTGEVVHRIRSFIRKGELKLEPIAINVLISDVMRLAEMQARAMAAEIELDLAIGLPEIIGDRMQLSQMLLNLARNGLEAMSAVDGQKVLKMRSFLNFSGDIEVEVEDCGCGLSTALALDVITPFVTTKAEGLGMGLAICKTVADNHQGRLWATSAKPAGTVFHVALPVR